MTTQTPTQVQLNESGRLLEASLSGRTLSLTVIRAGFNTSKSRYYTPAALKETGVAVFAGRKMFLNHATWREEDERPEGDLRQWVAQLVETRWDEEQQAITGMATIVEPAFAERMKMLDEAGLLSEMGVSIRALADGEQVEIEGVPTFRVDEFIASPSVDFVTEPGAGGRVLSRESHDPGAEARAHQEEADMEELKEALRRATEAEGKVSALERERDEERDKRVAAESALEAVKQERALAETQARIGRLIEESKLPDVSRQHLAESLKGETDIEKAREAIARHADYVKSLQEAAGGATVKDMGDGTSGDAGTGSVDEAAADERLSRAFARMGLDESHAALAARGRG